MDLTDHLELSGGATTWSRMQAAGVARAEIRRAVALGTLVAVRRDAYVAAEPEQDFYARRSVAVALSRPGDALAGPSAVAARRLPLLGTPVTVYLNSPGARTTRAGIVTWPGNPPSGRLAQWPGATAVSVAVAILQTALVSPRETALVAADAALHAGLVTAEELVAAQDQLHTRRHYARLAWLLSHVDEACESPGETLSRLALAEYGVKVTSQVKIYDDVGLVGRVDFLDEENRTVYEFDGAVKYAGADGRAALMEEKRREDRLRRLGYRVVRLTWNDVRGRGLARLLAA